MSNNWAAEEFKQADLGDQRLNQRLIELALRRAKGPHASIAQSGGDLAATRAAYRFYDNPRVFMEDILKPHRHATAERMQKEAVVLAVQDTTQIDLTHHPHTHGVGYLQDLQHTGFLLHSTLMVTPKRQPLGLIQEQVWIRDAKDFGKAKKRHERPISQKESHKWLDSLRAMVEIQGEVPDTQLINVGDSEADIYALFQEAERWGALFLVRACQDRLVEGEEERHLWKYIENQPIIGHLQVAVPRQANRPARTAKLSVRLAAVNLRPPKREPKDSLPHVSGWALIVREDTQPASEEPIEWRLITNVPTDNYEQACERVAWYSCRWVVEMFHRVLKSGCRIEERQFDDVENTKRFLALDSIVAWRVLYLTLNGRETPQTSCADLFEIHEWQALYCFIHKVSQPPQQPPALGDMLRWIARLGGFTGSSKMHPGTTILWQGLQRLNDISQAWLVFHGDP